MSELEGQFPGPEFQVQAFAKKLQEQILNLHHGAKIQVIKAGDPKKATVIIDDLANFVEREGEDSPNQIVDKFSQGVILQVIEVIQDQAYDNFHRALEREIDELLKIGVKKLCVVGQKISYTGFDVPLEKQREILGKSFTEFSSGDRVSTELKAEDQQGESDMAKNEVFTKGIEEIAKRSIRDVFKLDKEESFNLKAEFQGIENRLKGIENRLKDELVTKTELNTMQKVLLNAINNQKK